MSLIKARDSEHVVRILEESPDVVLYFTGNYCGACKSLTPNLPKIVNRYDGIKFVKVDAEECEKLMDICNISALPTFAMFRNGSEVKRSIGANLKNIVNDIDSAFL